MLRESLATNPLYPVAQTCYQAVFNRSRLRTRRLMRDFYGQFFSPGDLVFDIGANVGEYADVFSAAGATVVAVEPNPACCTHLYKLAQRRPVRVEACAVSDHIGSVDLQVCEHSIFSTIDPAWVEQTRNFPSYQGVEWKESLTVPLVTLDNLIRRHGKPAFIKIDVEGLEDKVLSGLSQMPNYVSFEYNVRLNQVALRALAFPLFDHCRFNAIEGREFSWTHANWKTRSEIIEWLNGLTLKGEEYGDIFVSTS